jgi:transcriptional regulator with GAF, ATPase, and Fis domain
MTEFFETRMGQRFYNASIPRLIDALEDIGKELKRANDMKDLQQTSPSKVQNDKIELTPENIKKALRNNKDVIAAAAREMGYSREHLQRTMKKMKQRKEVEKKDDKTSD